MKQLFTKDGEPLLQFLPVVEEREHHTLSRHCPFIGLARDSETVMAYPTLRNHCHRLHLSQRVSSDYQSTHCLTFAHRHCPVLLGSSSSVMPSHIAANPTKRRSIFVILGVTSVFIFLAIAFFLFSGLQLTRARSWFFDANSTGMQQELISTPGALQTIPEQSVPARLLPPDNLAASEALPIEAHPADPVGDTATPAQSAGTE